MQVPASLAGSSKLIYKYKQSLQVQSKQRRVLSWALLLRGRGGRRVAVAFIAWPWCVSSHRILCCGCCRCVATVGVVLRSRLLRHRGVCRRVASCRGRGCCVGVVGVVLRSHLLRGHGVCRRAVLCRGCGCCVIAVGVFLPYCVAVAMGGGMADS